MVQQYAVNAVKTVDPCAVAGVRTYLLGKILTFFNRDHAVASLFETVYVRSIR